MFRYDGTTCTNMGRPLAFQYNVKLGRAQEGYPIREQQCAPAPGDTGHTSMCQYHRQRRPLMAAIDSEKPLHGTAARMPCSHGGARQSRAGCYCDPASREHKWGLVLETIHYALAQKEMSQDAGAMMKKLLQEAMPEHPLLGDGAMGTQLMFAGLEQGNCGEAWNLTHPERVLAIQRRYAEAGSDCILTNTFGGSRIMLNRHGQRGQRQWRSTRPAWRSRARHSAAATAT